jgi:hypothetical protein
MISTFQPSNVAGKGWNGVSPYSSQYWIHASHGLVFVGCSDTASPSYGSGVGDGSIGFAGNGIGGAANRRGGTLASCEQDI